MTNEELKNLEKDFFLFKQKEIKLSPFSNNLKILDIGGGGEGIIGLLNGNNVVSIDKLKNELDETNNDSLKIVMDATKMSFCDNSFDISTAYFSFMYMPLETKRLVFKEVYRVLKKDGIFKIWDIQTSDKDFNNKENGIVFIKSILPNKTIEAGFGTNISNIIENDELLNIAKKIGFSIIKTNYNNEVIEIELKKGES